jgi:hypothetical protein
MGSAPAATDGSTPSRRAVGVDRVDGLVAVALGLTLFALYSATFQERHVGDGLPLVRMFVRSLDGPQVWPHVLYMPAARALYRMFDWSSPVHALCVLSSLGGAIGAACVYVVCRAFDATRAAAVLATLLLALSPGYWFYSTTIEVTGLHLGCVGLCAAVTLLAPWHRPLLAALITAAFLPLLFLSHQSGLFLGPGFVLLAQYARSRCAPPGFSMRTLIFGIGPLFLASFLFAILLSAHLQNKSFAELVGLNSRFVAEYQTETSLQTFYRLWLEPLGVLLPLALAAVALRGVRGWGLAAVAGLVLPSMAFFTLWGVDERGAYALAGACFVAVTSAALLVTRVPKWRVAAILLVVLQGAGGYASLAAFDAPVWGEENRSRARAVERVLGSRGTLFSVNFRFQEIETELPLLTEINLYPDVYRAWSLREPTEVLAGEVGERIESAVELGGDPVALDVSFRIAFESAPQHLKPYLDALEERLAATCSITRCDDARWPLWLLSPRPPTR